MVNMNNMKDSDVISFYRTEYFKEWNLERKSGFDLTAEQIKARFGFQEKRQSFFNKVKNFLFVKKLNLE